MYLVLLFKFRRHLCKGSITGGSAIKLPLACCPRNFNNSNYQNKIYFSVEVD